MQISKTFAELKTLFFNVLIEQGANDIAIPLIIECNEVGQYGRLQRIKHYYFVMRDYLNY